MNSFGSYGWYSIRYPLYDPREPRESRRRFRRDAVPLLARANSFYCSTGRYPSRGWILLARADYNKIDKYSNTLQLDIGDVNDPNNVSTLKNLSIVQAQCVTRGLSSDPNALYLVELTDGRGILENRWFKFPTTSAYNIRAPAYPQTFHPQSMNGGTTWTWSTMIQDLWQQMGAFLGAWPGLPSAPAGTPEGFWFEGVPAFSAMCDILEHLGLTIACDLQQDSPFTIVSDGVDDPAESALQTKYLPNLEDDLEWIDVGAGRVPAVVKILFRKRYEVYGTEETVRRDSPQWDMTPLYSVSVAAPAAFAGALGIHHIWSDFTVCYNQDGVPLAADVTTATTIAHERVTQYFDNIYSRTSGATLQTYTGALPFSAGSQVDVVRWYQDYSEQDRQGWKTQISREISLPWSPRGED